MKFLFKSILLFVCFWSFLALCVEQKANKKPKTQKLDVSNQKVAKPEKSSVSALNETSKTEIKRSVSDEDLFNDWRKISFLSTSENAIYENKKNSNMLLSFQIEKGIPVAKRKDLSVFFEKVERQKEIILLASNIKNIKITSDRFKSHENMSFIYISGSYTSVITTEVFFEEWRFYSNEASVYLLFSNSEPIEDFASIEGFIRQWLSFFSGFSESEKKPLLDFVQERE